VNHLRAVLVVTGLLSGLALVGTAAPVPKQMPPKLTMEAMLGEWTMRWGDIPGSMSLGTNGDYGENFGGSPFVGSWWIEDNELVIHECPVSPLTGDLGPLWKFRFKPVEVRDGYFKGVSAGGLELVLKRNK
jgi:hypothetical protein